MAAFGFGSFAAPEPVRVEAYTDAYRVSGTVTTPFRRVAEILNQLPSGHLAVEDATLLEHGDAASMNVRTALVSVDEVLILVAPQLDGGSSTEMRIAKQPMRTMLAVPPFRLTGTLHVAVGAEAFDGVLNMPDRFVAMTGVRIASVAFPALDREVPIVAVCRRRAQILTPDEPAADVADGEEAEAH